VEQKLDKQGQLQIFINHQGETVMKAKSVIIFGLSTLIVVLAITGGVLFNDYQKEQEAQIRFEQDRGDALAMKLFQRDSLINDYVETINQIEKDILLIKEKENLLDVQTQDPELAQDNKVRISEDIQLIYSLIEENRNKVAALSKKLKKSGVEVAALNEKVRFLTGVIEERDSSLVALNQQLADRDLLIADLTDQKGQLETVINDQKDVIANQVNELHKAYFAAGNFKDLEEKGILTKEGGFLGLGKNKSLHNTVVDTSFQMIDITTTTSFTVNAKKAELITEHPEGSYEWVEEGEVIAYMVINNPDEFWKISKYAVLETK
jgi:hypothetical protein